MRSTWHFNSLGHIPAKLGTEVLILEWIWRC